MNGIHDMGGMHGMGAIRPEAGEPVFHAGWEARVLALNLAAGAWRKWNIDASRHQIEQIAPADYLRMSYYEKWFVRLVELLVKSGLVTRAEIETGVPAPDSVKTAPPLTAAQVPAMLSNGSLASRPAPAAPKFAPGDRVRARNLHPTGHTRLPRYARGRMGVIDRLRGGFVFPDTNAHFLGENPQQIYSVRFAARELWGDAASPRDAVYIDLWEDHLEPA